MEELLRERGTHITPIPFFTETTEIINKQFRNAITLRSIRLEGDLSTSDKTTVEIDKTSRVYYGTFTIYPDRECKSLIITPAYQANRVGTLTLVYEGVPFDLSNVGTDQDLVMLVARGKSVLAGHGQINVATAGTRVQLTTTKTRVVEIRAKKTNTGKIYVGGSTVTSANGYILEPDQPVQLPLDASTLYIDASVNGEGVSWIGWL